MVAKAVGQLSAQFLVLLSQALEDVLASDKMEQVFICQVVMVVAQH
jgi:hypothetical protein